MGLRASLPLVVNDSCLGGHVVLLSQKLQLVSPLCIQQASVQFSSSSALFWKSYVTPVPGLAPPLPPSLPILPELQDPMRLEVTHPDLGTQLPVISIVEQVTEGKRVLIDCTDSFQSLLMTLGDKENY